MTNESGSDQHHPAPNTQPVQTGNASNPSPHTGIEPAVSEQLLSKQAEKYLREAGNIEDEPDAQDVEEMDEEIKQQKEENE